MTLDHVSADPVSPAGSAGTNGGDGGDPVPPRHRRAPRRRQALASVAGLAVIAAAIAGVVASRGDSGGGNSGASEAGTTTAPVEVRDLVLSDSLVGELSFGEADSLTAGRDGVVTEVSESGSTLGQGDVLFSLDLQPTVLLHGDIPAFRDLSVDADPGADVAQLEQSLVDLGLGDAVTVDTKFTQATADAVKAWEEDLGRSTPDGVVTLGEVVFAPNDLRIAEATARPGTQVQSGGEVGQVTATAKVVTLELTFDEAASLEAGTPVELTLPDATEITGTITSVATEPSSSGSEGSGSGGEGSGDEGSGGDEGEGSGGGSEETYPVTITLDDPAAADSFDSGAVEVTVERRRVEDATAVPVTALLAQSGGGYGLHVADDSRTDGYRTVPVEVGTIAGDWVEVSGDGIKAGVEVVVPE